MDTLSLFLCFKYLCKRRIVFLSIAAVALCCALLVSVASLFDSFISALETSANQYTGDVFIAGPAGRRIPQYEQLIQQLEDDPAVDSATAVMEGQGLLLLGKGNVRGVSIWGIELPKRLETMPLGESLMKLGADSDEHKDAYVYLGVGLAAKPDPVSDEYDLEALKEMIDKRVVLISGTRETEKPQTIKLSVKDISQTGLYDFDNYFVYMPIETLSSWLYPNKESEADKIHIKISSSVSDVQAAERVRMIWETFATETLQWRGYLIRMADIQTSRQLQSFIVKEYRKQLKVLMMIFGVVSTGVILLIFCIFYMIVITKQKDIAIIKSCGLSSISVMNLFVMFGLMIGVVGAVLGVILGFVVVENVNSLEQIGSRLLGMKLWKSSLYMFDAIPAEMNWDAVVWIFCVSVLASGLGAVIPAITAARLHPVKLLRYE